MDTTIAGKGRAVVHSRLTNSYRIKPHQIVPATISSMALAHTPSGDPVLFVVDQNGGVVAIRRDAASATGWKGTDLNRGGSSLQFDVSKVWSTDLKNGDIAVYAIDYQRVLRRAIYNEGSPVDWRVVDPPQRTIIIEPFLRTGLGHATISISPLQPVRTLEFKIIDGEPYDTPWFYTALADFQIVRTSTGFGQLGSYRIGHAMYTGTFSASGDSRVAENFFTSELAAASLEDAPSEIFGTNANGKLYYFAQPPDQAHKLIPVLIGGNLEFSNISAAYNQEVPEVFGIANNRLYHIRAIPGPGGKWTTAFPLYASRQFQRIIASRGTDGNSEVFALSAEGGLYRISQDLESLDWHIANLALPGNDETVEAYRSYSTEFTLQSPEGARLANYEVRLCASDSIPATINGNGALLDPAIPTVVKSNASGQVNVSIEADSLYTPALRITADFMDPGEVVTAEPASYLRDFFTDSNRFNVIALRNATLQTPGHPNLLPADQNTQPIAEMIVGNVSRSLLLHRTARIPQSSGERLRHDLDFAAIPEQHWHVHPHR